MGLQFLYKTSEVGIFFTVIDQIKSIFSLEVNYTWKVRSESWKKFSLTIIFNLMINFIIYVNKCVKK